MIGLSKSVKLSFAIMPQGESGGKRVLYIEDGIIKHVAVDHSSDLKAGQSVKVPLNGVISAMNGDGTYNIRLLDSELQNIQDALGDERCNGDKDFAYLKKFNAELCNVRCSDVSPEGKDPAGWSERNAKRERRHGSGGGWWPFFGHGDDGAAARGVATGNEGGTTPSGLSGDSAAAGQSGEGAPEGGAAHGPIFERGCRVHAFIDPFNSIDGDLRIHNEFAQSELERECGHLCEVLEVKPASNKNDFVYNLRIIKHGSTRINKVKEWSLVRAMDIGTRVHCTEDGWITRPPGVITSIHSNGTYGKSFFLLVLLVTALRFSPSCLRFSPSCLLLSLEPPSPPLDIAFSDIDHSGKTVLVNKMGTSVLKMRPMLLEGDNVRFVLSGWVRRSVLQGQDTESRATLTRREDEKRKKKQKQKQQQEHQQQRNEEKGNNIDDEARKRVFDVSFAFRTHMILHEVASSAVQKFSNGRIAIGERTWLSQCLFFLFA